MAIRLGQGTRLSPFQLSGLQWCRPLQDASERSRSGSKGLAGALARNPFRRGSQGSPPPPTPVSCLKHGHGVGVQRGGNCRHTTGEDWTVRTQEGVPLNGGGGGEAVRGGPGSAVQLNAHRACKRPLERGVQIFRSPGLKQGWQDFHCHTGPVRSESAQGSYQLHTRMTCPYTCPA